MEPPPNLAILEANLTQVLSRDGSISSRAKDRSLNLFHTLSRKYKTFLSPGVGEYQVERADVLKKSPVCKIGNSRRFEKVSSMQKYKVNLPISY